MRSGRKPSGPLAGWEQLSQRRKLIISTYILLLYIHYRIVPIPVPLPGIHITPSCVLFWLSYLTLLYLALGYISLYPLEGITLITLLVGIFPITTKLSSQFINHHK